MNTENASILVVEDDLTMREMLEYNLDRAGYSVSTAADGSEGVEMAKLKKADLVLLDVMLPSTDGITACSQIRAARPEIAIIMITALSEEEDRLKGFEAGADDYVTKPFSMEELLARIKANLRRSGGKTDEAARDEKMVFGDLELDSKEYRVHVGGQEIEIRPKEMQVLLLLTSAPGALFTRQQITEQVWGYEFVGNSRTIDVHVKNLRQKLAENSEYSFIDTVRGLGYRFRLNPKKG